MRQYCFNRTTDLRLLWELKARMRTEEWMYRDLGTEPRAFFQVGCGLFYLFIYFLQTKRKVLFVWLLMREQHGTLSQ